MEPGDAVVFGAVALDAPGFAKDLELDEEDIFSLWLVALRRGWMP
jgi:hypothetical protein